MADASAKLSNYRQAPRKVRLVADLVRGKSVVRALAILQALPKRASEPMEKLIRSAAANATVSGATQAELYISSIQVNKGLTLKRSMPRARGRAFPIHKHNSHITLELSRKAKAQVASPKVETAAK